MIAEAVEKAPIPLGVAVVIAVMVLVALVMFFKDNW